eukprot:TRINITY_DN725_c0_g2_i1.p1 TRINITY_DN725_c0_g2~~TRINITY_DN725_c0_g2_i1.p1  ORF type:complete len:284 (-),score=15.07 TRINITY_DN725_c0_g2_i1:402-1253(-)
MVSLIQHLRGRCSPEQTTGCCKVSRTDSRYLIQEDSDGKSSFTSGCSSLASPRTKKSVTFDNMMAFIDGVTTWELNGWSTQKIWQFIKYLIDRLENAKAYRGYFRNFLHILDVLSDYIMELKKKGQRLAKGKKRHDLIKALMYVQALNKAYGRRGDIKASCHILAKKVSEDFQYVSTLLVNAMLKLNTSLKVSRTDFIIPRDSRRVFSSLLDVCSKPSQNKQFEILSILEKFGVRAADFTDGDVEWLQNELDGLNHENMYRMSVMLEWLVYVLRPESHMLPTM